MILASEDPKVFKSNLLTLLILINIPLYIAGLILIFLPKFNTLSLASLKFNIPQSYWNR